MRWLTQLDEHPLHVPRDEHPLHVPLDNKGVKIKYSKEQLRNVFKKNDTNNDGRLSKKELKLAFTELDSHFPSYRAHRGLHHADANDDGYVDIENELEALVVYVVKKCGYTIS